MRHCLIITLSSSTEFRILNQDQREARGTRPNGNDSLDTEDRVIHHHGQMADELGLWGQSRLEQCDSANMGRWARRPLTDYSFHMTQTLTECEYFKHYLNRLGHASDAKCLYCQHLQDIAEHMFFDCPHWGQYRQAVRAYVGRRSAHPSDIKDLLCVPENIPTYGQDPVLYNRIIHTVTDGR